MTAEVYQLMWAKERVDDLLDWVSYSDAVGRARRSFLKREEGGAQ